MNKKDKIPNLKTYLWNNSYLLQTEMTKHQEI